MSSNSAQKLANLQPYQRGITFSFKVIKTEAVRKVQSRHDGSNHRVADVLIGDETGVMLLTLWDDEIDQIQEGKSYRVVGGQSGLFQGRMQVSLGRSGKLEDSAQAITEVNTDRNLSSKPKSPPKDARGRKSSGDRRDTPVRRTRGFMWSRIERKSE